MQDRAKGGKEGCRQRIYFSTVVPYPADRSSGVQKVFAITDEKGGLYVYKGTYSMYTVKTGIFSISFPQTVPLQITDLLCKHLGNTVFVY